LINRIQPEEALKITLGLLNKAPNSTIAMLNHAAALLMYRRFEDAEKLLDRLDPARLRAEEARQYHLANFEVQASRGQAEKAWASYDKIDRQQLFPPQAAWIESIAKKLPPREQPSGGSEPAK
jgi:predicted Zn-dependent protease